MADGYNHAPPERWQHGAQFEIGNDGTQRVQHPAYVLLRRGKIGGAEVEAAERYYRDYALGWEHRVTGDDSASPGDHLYAFIHARNAVGAAQAQALAIGVLNDTPCGNLAYSLMVLADHYAKVDGARPAPAARIRAVSVGDTK